MLKFMRKYNKKLLAVATVFLTVAFFWSPNKSGRTPHDIVIGKIGDEKITYAEVQGARNDWNLLKQNIFIPQQGQTGRTEYIPLAALLGLGDDRTLQTIDSHESMFLLLLKEAQLMGVAIPQRDVDAVCQQVNVRLEDGRIVLASMDNLGEERFLSVQQAVREFLMAAAARDRAASVVKVSQPMIDNRLATQLQQIKVQLIEVDAKDYMDKVPAPTAEQMQKQFDTYADVLAPDATTVAATSDPAGFGYKLPDRVKLQYISISRDQAKAAVKASKTDYDWEVEAQGYYAKNRKLFPVTQPTSKPADPLTLDANARSSTPTTNPTTRPYTEVREAVLNALIEPAVDKLVAQVATKITATMASDYGTYRLAHGAAAAGASPATAPSAAPASSSAAPFDSFEYLQKLAADIQKEFKVLPTVASLGESFLTRQQLEKLPGIGESYIEFQRNFLPFADYALVFAAPLHPNQRDALHLFELSRPLLGMDRGTIYFFRLTAVDPAHRPGSQSEVAEQVAKDVKLTEAMKLAHAAAEEAMKAAQSSGMRQAAIGAGKTAFETGFFDSGGSRPIPNFAVAENSRRQFAEAAFKLLGDVTKDSKSAPISIIDLPRDGKVMVAQLADLQSQLPEEQVSLAAMSTNAQLAEQFRRAFVNHWFSWDDLQRRLNFQDELRGGRKGSEPTTSPSDDGSAG